MPTVDGILETALYVDDLDRAARFYETLFGFEVVVRGERLYALGVADRQILLLCKKGASADMATRAHDGRGQLHVAFAIPAAELDAWEAWLGQHDVAVEEKKTWSGGGVSLYFRDPDGHAVEVATPGVWPRVY